MDTLPTIPPAAAGRPGGGLGWGRAALLALVLEGALLLGAGGLLAQVAASPPEKPEVTLVFDDTPPPRPLEKKPPEPVKQPTPPVAKALPRPVSLHSVAHPTPVPPPPVPTAVPAPPVVADSPVAVPAPPPRPPAPEVTDRRAEREAEFAAQVKAAVQAAVVYPLAARAMGYRGRARVEFVLRDGVARQPHIVESSGIPMIDAAALAAVGNALYPATPESLRGRDINYQVYVELEFKSGR